VSPELAAAMRLLNQAKAAGFRFERVTPGRTVRCWGSW
jgi:hypothetical protein